MADKELVEKVVEALSLDVQEASVSAEISKLNKQIETLQAEGERLEKAKANSEVNQKASVEEAQTAKEIAEKASGVADEAIKLAKDALTASKRAEQLAAEASKDFPANFNKALEGVEKSLSDATSNRDKQNTKLNEIRGKRAKLKTEGVELNLATGINRITI